MSPSRTMTRPNLRTARNKLLDMGMRALTAPAALPTVSGLLDFIISDNQFLALLCRSVVGRLGSKCHLCGVGAKVLKVSNLTQ